MTAWGVGPGIPFRSSGRLSTMVFESFDISTVELVYKVFGYDSDLICASGEKGQPWTEQGGSHE